MHRPALQTHLANLHLTMTGQGWTDFGHGWLLRFWQSIQANHAETLVNDPFWQDDGGRRYTPNHVEITWDGLIPEYEFEPSSIGPVSWKGIPDIETNVCAGQPTSLAGRLDEVTYLIERCHEKDTWPWRKPNTST
jgi:hypothetical protein